MAIPSEAEALLSSLNPELGNLHTALTSQRRLSELRGCFADTTAYERALGTNDPIIYTLATVAPGKMRRLVSLPRAGAYRYISAIEPPTRTTSSAVLIALIRKAL